MRCKRAHVVGGNNDHAIVEVMYDDMLSALTVLSLNTLSIASGAVFHSATESTKHVALVVCKQWFDAKAKISPDPSFTNAIHARSLLVADAQLVANICEGVARPLSAAPGIV